MLVACIVACLSFLLLNMRLMEALSPVTLLGVVAESLEGVDDILLAVNEGPRDVRSVNLETCTLGRMELSFLPCDAPAPLLLGHAPSNLGVGCSNAAASISAPLCTYDDGIGSDILISPRRIASPVLARWPSSSTDR